MIYEHVGFIVKDLEKSIEFYQQAFGFEILKKTAVNAYLYHGNDMLELMQCEQPDKMQNSLPAPGELMCGTPGLIHIGIRVDKLEETMKRVEKWGGVVIEPPEVFKPSYLYTADVSDEKLQRAIGRDTNMRIAVMADPDGVLLELLER